MKKPILVLFNHPLKALCWNHLLPAGPADSIYWSLYLKKKYLQQSCVHRNKASPEINSFIFSLDSPLHVWKTSTRSFALQVCIDSNSIIFLHMISAPYYWSFFYKSPLNLLNELLVFLIMWIPSTNTILSVRPNKCFYRLNITLVSLNLIVILYMPNTLVALLQHTYTA